MRREHQAHTLQTTALVHEAYLKLCGSQEIDWRDRSHFYAVAARQMRRVLIDYARRSGRDKRQGDRNAVVLDDFDGCSLPPDERLLALDEALTSLEELDERASQIVELRFFSGLSESEVAEALHISVATVKRDWDFARTWLMSRLT
jgi:RNA polymerase sigma factor (TIGR02999 family)